MIFTQYDYVFMFVSQSYAGEASPQENIDEAAATDAAHGASPHLPEESAPRTGHTLAGVRVIRDSCRRVIQE